MNESVRRKQEDVRAQMAKLEQKLKVGEELVTPDRQAIVTTDPILLIAKLKSSELTAVEVLRAFQSKALEVTKRLNCVTEFIPDAEKWAEECDATDIDNRGPLHGLPISIKDNIDVRGMDSTMGLAKRLFNPVVAHAPVVGVAIRKGAVPFCKTNVSQLMISFCCTNPVFGETTNVYSSTRTPGGSSGGEGALIGGGGSILGIGTDLAGSVRVPAAFCGCVGFKPTSNYLSNRGLRTVFMGIVGISCSPGIMGQNVEIVSACMEALSEGNAMHKNDSSTVPLLWNQLDNNPDTKLVFGYYDSLEVFPSSPGARRAVHMAKKALEAAGHQVIPFEAPNSLNIVQDAYSFFGADNGTYISNCLEREVIDPTILHGFTVLHLHYYLKLIVKFLLRPWFPLSSEAIQTKCFKTDMLWKFLRIKDEREEEIERNMKSNGIDLLLSPAYAIPAPQSHIPVFIGSAGIYTMMANYFDFPSGSVPVTKECDIDQEKLSDYSEKDYQYKIAKQATKGAQGMPIGVLVTGLKWEEELVCRGMQELQNALKNHQE